MGGGGRGAAILYLEGEEKKELVYKNNHVPGNPPQPSNTATKNV